VFSPSPRGCDGFGREFSSLNDKDLGGNEIIDVIYAAKYISKKPYLIAFALAFPLFIIGISPFIFYYGFGFDISLSEIGLGVFGDGNLFGFMVSDETGKTAGPFGLGATILGLSVPLSIALFFSIAYRMKTKELIKARNASKNLENEFASSLFQLGNRLGDGTPAEMAFGKVAESTRHQKTHEFFSLVNQNIAQGGMSLEKAIFDRKKGALLSFPSNL